MKPRTRKLASYVPTLTSIAHDNHRPMEYWDRQCAEMGGFNPWTLHVTKICCTNDAYIGEYLDHITAAVEAGVVKRNEFVEQLFASNEDFLEFVKHVSTYCGRIHDRWHRALCALAGLDVRQPSLLSAAEVLSALRSR